MELTLRARWVFPGGSEPALANGTVTLADERIVNVAAAGNRTPDIDLGNAALVPGFVNTHTHLDLTGMRGLAPPTPDFPAWLREVIAHRRARSPEEVRADIRAGLAESVRAGVTLLGDISGDGSSWDILAAGPIRAVVFRELLGLTELGAAETVDRFQTWHTQLIPSLQALPGISPHAPYSVRWPLFSWANTQDLPVAVHLAESTAEMELLFGRSGPFVDFLQELGVWDADGLAEGPDHILRMASGLNPVLIVHGNYLWPTIPFPANASLIYCPRTHAAFAHSPHPFQAFLQRGVRVALGTDGLASNPDLDLLAEARLIRWLYPDFPGPDLLRMLTLSGAEALGWSNETGELVPGKSADLAVVQLPDRDEDPHTLLFNSDLPVRATMCQGCWLHDTEAQLAPVLAEVTA